jgi:hypothetical protein
VLPPHITISLILLSPGDCKTILDPLVCTSSNFLSDPHFYSSFQLQLGGVGFMLSIPQVLGGCRCALAFV